MFEQFPYTDFHQLNLDWIVKIAKDFLDQYTHIQEVITQGLEDLDTKATELQALLDEWYNTHSQDIANQLADALSDLNEWYTTHQNYLNQYLTDSITAFNNAADQKAEQTIASIPDDYTTLSNRAVRNTETMFNARFIDGLNIWDYFTGSGTDNGVTFTPIIKNGKPGYALSGTSTGGIIRNIYGYVSGETVDKIPLTNIATGEKIHISGSLSSAIRVALEAFNSNNQSLGFVQDSGYGAIYTKTADAAYIRLYVIVNNNTATNVEIYPYFVLNNGTADKLKNSIKLNADKTYSNICDITKGNHTQSGVTFTRRNINGLPAYEINGVSTDPIFFYLVDNYIENDIPTGTELIVSGSYNNAVRVALEYKDQNLGNTAYVQDMGNTGAIFNVPAGMFYYRPCIIINRDTQCDHILIIPRIIRTDSLQYLKPINKLKLMVFGDSIVGDDFAGIGTKIAEVGNMTLIRNWAHGGASASDWYYQGSDISPIELNFDAMYNNGKNVLANQVRAALQYTTPTGEQVQWYHPVTEETYTIPTTYGVGLGHTDEIPDVIFINISTNDGHTEYQGVKTTSVVDNTNTVIQQSYGQLDRASIASGVRWAVETLLCAYPTANIFISSPLQCGYNDAAEDPEAFSYSAGDTKREIIEKMSRFESIHYIDAFSESGYSFFVAKNGGGLHPNGINRYNIARYFVNELNNKYSVKKVWF